MNILIASSEVVPFAKTGGLADVCGALPIELARSGQNPAVIMPGYERALQTAGSVETTGIDLEIPIGSKVVRGSILRSELPGSQVPIFFVQQADYYNRRELYTADGKDYKDNCERFVFFCRAAIETITRLPWEVHVVHCNDWQTGLIPAYLNAGDFGAEPVASLITIHNMAYQGSFWHWDMLLTGLDWKYFNWRQMEFHGQLNLLKTGIVFADSINTVSPTYATEIQSQPLGCGLEGVLRHRSHLVSGILNGVSYDIWNPETDTHLATTYRAATVVAGKAKCKAALQEEMGLPLAADTPVLGLVGRLADQKGWDLIIDVIRKWAPSLDVQWVILGTGQPDYQDELFALAQRFPERVAAKLTFSDHLAHCIEGGADIFVMPSRYEPCGLNQLYSLRYGTVPVVRATGGLADTVVDATPESLASGLANGFSFKSYDSASLELALRRACELFRNNKQTWTKLVKTGMSQDWSWATSAKRYVELYESTVQRFLDRSGQLAE